MFVTTYTYLYKFVYVGSKVEVGSNGRKPLKLNLVSVCVFFFLVFAFICVFMILYIKFVIRSKVEVGSNVRETLKLNFVFLAHVFCICICVGMNLYIFVYKSKVEVGSNGRKPRRRNCGLAPAPPSSHRPRSSYFVFFVFGILVICICSPLFVFWTFDTYMFFCCIFGIS